jgi:hypothetical protein
MSSRPRAAEDRATAHPLAHVDIASPRTPHHRGSRFVMFSWTGLEFHRLETTRRSRTYSLKPIEPREAPEESANAKKPDAPSGHQSHAHGGRSKATTRVGDGPIQNRPEGNRHCTEHQAWKTHCALSPLRSPTRHRVGRKRGLDVLIGTLPRYLRNLTGNLVARSPAADSNHRQCMRSFNPPLTRRCAGSPVIAARSHPFDDDLVAGTRLSRSRDDLASRDIRCRTSAMVTCTTPWGGASPFPRHSSRA